jgi:hypothetical protein
VDEKSKGDRAARRPGCKKSSCARHQKGCCRAYRVWMWGCWWFGRSVGGRLDLLARIVYRSIVLCWHGSC